MAFDPTAAINPMSDLIIRERSGQKRELRLAKEALPYRPAKLPKRSTRARYESYQGSTDETHQLFGPSWGPWVFRGSWRDRWLGAGNDPLATLETLGVKLPLLTAEEVVAAVDSLWLEGQELEVDWHIHSYRCTVESFEPEPHRPQDYDWELVLRVVGPGTHEAQAAYTDEFNFVKDAGTILSTMSGWLTIARKQIQKLLSVRDKVTGTLDRIDGLRKQLDATINLAGDVVIAPIVLASRIAQTATDLTETWHSLQRQVVKVDAATEAAGRSFADTARAYGARSEIVRASREAAVTSAKIAIKARRRAQPRVLKIVTAKTAIDLRKLSTEVYGTPDGWVDIAAFNGFQGSTVQAGKTILVPERIAA